VADQTLSVLEPNEDLAFLPGEIFEIKARGPSGWKAEALCWDRKVKLELAESVDENNEGTGIYSIIYKIPDGFCSDAAPVVVKLEKGGGFLGLSKKEMKADSKGIVAVWDSTKIRVGETVDDKVSITLGTHYVRLGGPYLTEVPKGTRFEIIGRKGSRLKIRLSQSLYGWVTESRRGEKYVKILPENTPLPQAFFTYCIINGDDDYDRLWIPLKENVVFAITPETEPQNCLYIDFFNTFFATTWFSHKSGAKVIGIVTGEQIEDGRYRLTVPIKSKQNWGYWAEKDDRGLTIFVKRPPKFAEPPDSPLKGLTIAIEAGHGGRNTGAVGNMGIKEKTINSMAVKATRKIMEEKGASVVEVRPGDAELSLGKRVDHAIEADADFYLSIHANAAGTARGFLRVSGTSTYYKDKHCWLVAKLVYDELLKLDWDEFGVVGNFHYYPLRETSMPSMLVEQAFMSHPGDEARLLDPEYQKLQAEAIVLGMEKFLDMVRE
jgi:N-acetylmuramoyl-L-alanine amidase